MKKRIFISTSIPYINANLHIGHLLEFIQGDFLSRSYNLLGYEVFFATGSDENSLKVLRKAKKLNLTPQQYTKNQVEKAKALLKLFNIKYSHFQRTSSPHHKKIVRLLFEKVKKYTYPKEYQGWYCPECEAYLKEEELINGLCPIHKIKPTFLKEENLFFKLTSFKKELKEIYKKDKIKIFPQSKKKEILKWIDNLEDISITRSRSEVKNWGVKVPGLKNHIFYVWFDALINYLSHLDYPDSELFINFWKSKDTEKIHIIGKDILRFHSILWPAILSAAKIPLPTTLVVHGFLLYQGEKMSKSKGNTVDPLELAKIYHPDVLRYFFLREFSPFEDGNFSEERLRKRYQDDLAHGLGNLFSRIISLLKKEKEIEIGSNQLKKESNKLAENFRKYAFTFNFQKAIESIWKFISETDRYINQQKAWQISEPARKKIVFSTLWYSLKELSFYLQPVMPLIAEKIKRHIKLKDFNDPPKIVKITTKEILFPKLK